MASKKNSKSLIQHNTEKIDGGEQSSTVRRSPRISEQVMRPENRTLEKLDSSKSGYPPPSSSQKRQPTQIGSDNKEVSSTVNSTKQTLEKLDSSKSRGTPPSSSQERQPTQIGSDNIEVSSTVNSTKQTLEKLDSSKSGGTPPSSSQKGKHTQIGSDNIEVSSTVNSTKQTLEKLVSGTETTVQKSIIVSTEVGVQSDNTTPEKLESSYSEVAAIASLTETIVHKSKVVSTDVDFKDNTVSNDPDESTPTCPSGYEWDSDYEFPDDHEEESVVDSDANKDLSTPRSSQTDQTTNPTASLAIETDKEPILITTDIETTNATVVDIETNNETKPNSTNTDTVNRDIGSKTAKTSTKQNTTGAAPKKKGADKEYPVETSHPAKRNVTLKVSNTDSKTTILQFAEESICTMNLILLTWLMHSTTDCLACQPIANYRSLQVSSLAQKKFINAMVEPNNDIMEEMYGFLYEVTTTETENTLPIYRAYTVQQKDRINKKTNNMGRPDSQQGDVELHMEQNFIEETKDEMNENEIEDLQKVEKQFAKFPSDKALKQMATAFGLTREYTTTSSALVSEIFSDLLQHQQVIIDKLFRTKAPKETADSEEKIITRTAVGIQGSFFELRKKFQSKCKVRIAIIGGLHRTALAIHVLGNYFIGNHAPKREEKRSFYHIQEDSPVNSALAVHIFTNKGLKFNQPFLTSCRAYSETINARKHVAVQDTIRSQLYDLLTKKTTAEVDEKRYIPKQLLESTMVSYLLYKNLKPVFIETYLTLFDLFLYLRLSLGKGMVGTERKSMNMTISNFYNICLLNISLNSGELARYCKVMKYMSNLSLRHYKDLVQTRLCTMEGYMATPPQMSIELRPTY